MALALTHLTSAVDDTNATSYTTASVSPAANSLLVIGVVGSISGTPPTPTVTGFSAPWTAVQSSVFDTAGTQRTLFTFSAQMPASPGSAAIGISFGSTMSGAGWSIVQVTGHNTTSPTRLPVESHSTGTSQSTTLAALASPSNVALAFVADDEATTFTGANAFTILGQATGAAPVQAIGSLWKLNATNPATTSTGTAGQQWGMAAVEIQSASVTTGFPSLTVSLGLGSDALNASPSWTVIPATLVRSVSMTGSGRSLDLEDFEGGSGSIVFDNDDGRFTPGNAASPYYPNIELRMPVKIVASRGADTLIIRGYIDATPVKLQPPSKAFCEWPIVDAFTLLNEKDGEYPWSMAIRASTPKLWVNYNELSGSTAVDDSGNGYHGTYIGSPTLQVAFGTGTGATFDGLSQEADFPSSASITGTGDFAIEFYGDVAVTGTDQVVYGQYDYTLGQGVRAYVLSTGAAYLNTTDGSGSTNVTGTLTDIASGPEKHIIWRRQGTTHEILVNGVVDATATGTARNIPAAPVVAPGVGASVTIDALATYQGTMTQATGIAHFQALLAYHSLYAGQQIGYLLDTFAWPTADRSIDTGNTQVLGQFAPSGSVLDMIRLAAASDFGAVYITLAGIIRFRQRQAIMTTPYTTSQGTFGNGVGAIPAVVEGLRLDYDASRIKNDVTLSVNWQTGPIVTTPYTVSVRKADATSAARRGTKTWNKDVYTMAGDTSSTAVLLGSLAGYVLARYKDPMREVRELTLRPVEESDTTLWTHVLTRTQEDRITLAVTLPGGEVLSGDAHIQRIRHDIGPGKTWKTTWTISPADTQAYWIWDTSTWDTSTRWGV